MEEHRFEIGSEPTGWVLGRCKNTKENMANNPAAYNRIKVMCINTKEVYNTLAEAGRAKNVSAKIIKARIKNKLSDKNGNFWKYVEGEINE